MPVSVGHGTGLAVEAKSFTDTYYDNGAPKDYVSDLALTKDGQQVARHETRVNSPLIYDGVWFHQSSFGNGADVTVTEGGSGGLLRDWSRSSGSPTTASRASASSPSRRRGITVFVVEAASGQVLAGPARRLGPARGAQGRRQRPARRTRSSARASPPTSTGLTYTYERNRQYTGLTVKQDKGSWIVWLGSALLILGCYLVFFMPHRRVWVRVRDNADGTSRVTVGAPLKRDPGFEPVFRTSSRPHLHHHPQQHPTAPVG